MHPGWQAHHLHQLLHPGLLLVHNPLKWIGISLRTYRINSLFLNSIWFLFIVPVSFSLDNLLESTIKTKSSNLLKIEKLPFVKVGEGEQSCQKDVISHRGHLEDGRHDEGEGKDEEERHDESEQEGQVVAADEVVIFINSIFENSFLKNSRNNFSSDVFFSD